MISYDVPPLPEIERIPSAGVRAQLAFDQTVPRAFVHRTSVAEVFLTDALACADGRVLVAAQWPRTHALLHSDRYGYTDPLLMIETVRQAAIYLAHRFHEVPLSSHFIFTGLDFQLEDPAGTLTGDSPLNVVLDCAFRSSRTPRRTTGRLDCVLEIRGRRVGRASAGLLAVPPSLYEALRRRAARPAAPVGAGRPPKLPAALVGRERREDVLLSRTPDGFQLDVSSTHPGYFEHACDHLPGMVLVEGFRQAGYGLHHADEPRLPGRGLPRLLSGLQISFDAFGDLRSPVVLRREPAAAARRPGTPIAPIALTATQGAATLARGTVTLAPVVPGGDR
jgi:hypothetical protein